MELLRSALSSQIVTGPSLIRWTRIRAPNCPAAQRMPWVFSAAVGQLALAAWVARAETGAGPSAARGHRGGGSAAELRAS